MGAESLVTGPGRALPTDARAFFESRFGAAFGSVRIHTGPVASERAEILQARAYTLGENVVFARGQYAPDTQPGRQLLAHELTHVVQQRRNGTRVQRAENDTSRNGDALVDSTAVVNAYVNEALRRARDVDPTGASVPHTLASDIGSGQGWTRIEDWAKTLPSTQAALPAQSETKYKDVNYRIWPTGFAILNPSIKVAGVAIGSDKLGHFFQQGYQYYVVADRRQQGTEAAEAWGRGTELEHFGLVTTGVYSNADLEANRRGLQFYRDLAANPGLTFDISPYVNAKWSEVHNPNAYAPEVGTTVWGNLLSAGPWIGAFSGEGFDPRQSIAVAFAANGSSFVGSYSYREEGEVHEGTMSGTVSHVLNADGAIVGIELELSWRQGPTEGRGYLTSNQENRLVGTWGRAGSRDDGGTWELSRP